MRVLSLFDGISCGRLALERAGIPVEKYYSSEIDKWAIKISESNYPDIIRLGDVRNVEPVDVDLVIGGSPCQGFSLVGKKLNFEDPRSQLFFEYVRLIHQIRPKYFLLENVPMKQESQDVISSFLGVEPVMIDSALVSAQQRKRLYWANFPITQPEDKGIVLKDILESDKVAVTKSHGELYYRAHKSTCLDASYYKGADNRGQRTGCIEVGHAELNGHDFLKRVYSPEGKSPTLTAICGGNQERKVALDASRWRKLTPIECERLQTLPDKIETINIDICLDQVKSFVNAVEKNPKLLKLVSNVEKYECLEFVTFVESNTNQNYQQIENIAPQSVDIAIQTPIEECTKINNQESSLVVNNAVLNSQNQILNGIQSFVQQNVFITITEGKITHFGKEELPQNGNKYIHHKNGKTPYYLSLQEITQRVVDAESEMIEKIDLNFIFITLSHLNTKNLEPMLITLYWFVKIATIGYIQKTTSIESISLQYKLIDGYTAAVSNSQRYKAIGNGWTVDVIAHILKGIK